MFRQRGPRSLLAIGLMLLAVACTAPTPAPTPTPTILRATETPLAPTATLLQPPAYVARYQPIDVATALPPDLDLPAQLVIANVGMIRILSFRGQEPREIPDYRGCLATSPDGSRMAYCISSETSLTGKELVVLSADGQQRFVTPILEGWRWDFRTSWLDNEHLIFNLSEDPSRITSILATIVVNPITGEHLELPSDYPGLKPNPSGPAGTLHFTYSTVVYEPSLGLVVYPQTTTDGDYIVLWNRRIQQTLARLKTPGGFLRVPVWSPDAMQLVVAVITKLGLQPGEFVEELFSLDREGGVIQLTHFGDYFAQAEIGYLSWSPDKRYLAFWMRTSPSMCEGENLATLDMTTQQVTNYCILGSDEPTVPASAPVWSLDSAYIAIANYSSEAATSKVILVNPHGNWAAILAENAYPDGWLQAP